MTSNKLTAGMILGRMVANVEKYHRYDIQPSPKPVSNSHLLICLETNIMVYILLFCNLDVCWLAVDVGWNTCWFSHRRGGPQRHYRFWSRHGMGCSSQRRHCTTYKRHDGCVSVEMHLHCWKLINWLSSPQLLWQAGGASSVLNATILLAHHLH